MEWRSDCSLEVTLDVNSMMTIGVLHTLRAVNTLAYYFINLTSIFYGMFECKQFQDIHVASRRIINTSKYGIPVLSIGQSIPLKVQWLLINYSSS